MKTICEKTEEIAPDWPVSPRISDMEKTASLSPCGTYRWTLTRSWGEGPKACWVMLNPSTADHLKDDPTICRVIHFTKLWGFAGFTVVNLYPFMSPDPAACREWLTSSPEAVSRLEENLRIIRAEIEKAEIVLAAWGNNASDAAWIAAVVETVIGGTYPLFDALFCLGMTERGSPKHPLARGSHRVAHDQHPLVWRAA